MATEHMNAETGDFAETVLMPGDPLRAQHVGIHGRVRRHGSVGSGTRNGYSIGVDILHRADY